MSSLRVREHNRRLLADLSETAVTSLPGHIDR
jgi:hypothetical protein